MSLGDGAMGGKEQGVQKVGEQVGRDTGNGRCLGKSLSHSRYSKCKGPRQGLAACSRNRKEAGMTAAAGRAVRSKVRDHGVWRCRVAGVKGLPVHYGDFGFDSGRDTESPEDSEHSGEERREQQGHFKRSLQLLEAGDLFDGFSKTRWEVVVAQPRGCGRSRQILERSGGRAPGICY